MKIEEVTYKNVRCLRIYNESVELMVSLTFGPRVLFYGFIDGENIFRVFDDQLNQQDEKWHLYGGHRLWLAPEARPRSYYPDNHPVAYSQKGSAVIFTARIETETGFQKIIELSLAESGSAVTATHRLLNHNVWDIEVAAWALSVMNSGGRAIIPQEEFEAHSTKVLPARPVVLWPYTDMSDPRVVWGKHYIQMKQDDAHNNPIKIGVRNTKGCAAYIRNDTVFVKHHPFTAHATYPDMGSNAEFFTMPGFLEIESLSPLTRMAPGDELTHTETWHLKQVTAHSDEENLDAIFDISNA